MFASYPSPIYQAVLREKPMVAQDEDQEVDS